MGKMESFGGADKNEVVRDVIFLESVQNLLDKAEEFEANSDSQNPSELADEIKLKLEDLRELQDNEGLTARDKAELPPQILALNKALEDIQKNIH